MGFNDMPINRDGKTSKAPQDIMALVSTVRKVDNYEIMGFTPSDLVRIAPVNFPNEEKTISFLDKWLPSGYHVYRGSDVYFLTEKTDDICIHEIRADEYRGSERARWQAKKYGKALNLTRSVSKR